MRAAQHGREAGFAKMRHVRSIVTHMLPALLVGLVLMLAPGDGAVLSHRAAATVLNSEAVSVIATLTVTNRTAFHRTAEPITSGIPLAESAGVVTSDGVALLGPNGPVPAQLAVATRWGGAPHDASRPIRWLLADFAADVGPKDSVVYRLVRAAPGPVDDPISVSEDATGMTVGTGRARFRLSKTRFGLLESTVLNDGRVVGQVCIEARDRDGNNYTSVASPPRALVAETRGPLRTTVRIEGRLRGTAGDLIDCTVWLHFYRGSAHVKTDLRVENRRPPAYTETSHPDCWDIGSPNSVWIEDLSVRVPSQAATCVAFGIDDGAFETTLAASALLYQDSSGTETWNRYRTASRPRVQSYTTFRGWQLTRDEATIAAGRQALGWALLRGSEGAVGVAIRRFWQQYPKAIRVSADGVVELGLFPGEFASAHNLRAGEYKTHELVLDFEPGADFEARAAGLERPPFAVASSDYYARTRAFGQAAPRRDGAAADYEDANRRTLEPNPAWPYGWPPNGSMLDRITDYDFYGWQDFGDVPLDYEPAGEGAGQMNLKYNFDRGMWTQWARTGDWRWFDLADAGSRHIADIDILHAPNAAPHWSNGGYYGHSYHDEEGNSNPNRNYGAPHPDLAFGVPGLLALYHMTGYVPARAAALEVADNIVYRFDNTFGGNGEGWALCSQGVMNDNERPLANGLLLVTEAYRATGDPKYLATARSIVAYARASDQAYINGSTGSRADYVKPSMLNMYIAALGNYLDMLDEFRLPDTEDGRGSLLRYANFQLAHTYRTLAGSRAAFPYQWHLDGSDTGPDVCDWLLVGADAMSYAFQRSGDVQYLQAAGRLFMTGSADPCFAGDEPVYWFTKEAANNAVFGHVYLATVWEEAPWSEGKTRTTLTAHGSRATVGYGDTVIIEGSLQTTQGPVSHRSGVTLWSRRATSTWTLHGAAGYDVATATYKARMRCTENTVFQLRFSGDTSYTPAVSNSVLVRARAYLSRPWTAPTYVRRGRTFTVYGYLAPRHYGYTRLYISRRVGGTWRPHRRIYARNYSQGSVTRYRAVWRLRAHGRYFIRALHVDASHAWTWSPVRVFVVR